MKQSFIGSTVAMIVGAISALGQLSHLSSGVNMDNVVGGITAILGALAYRSAKEQRLALKPASMMRQRVEIVLLSMVCLPPIV